MNIGNNGPSFGCAFLVATSLILASVAHSVAAKDNARTEAIVHQRQVLMKKAGEHMRAIAGYVKGSSGTVEDVSFAVSELEVLANQIPIMFPKGSGMDDGLSIETGAKHEIWSDVDDFKSQTDAMLDELAAFLETAKTGDQDQLKSQFQQLGKRGCGGCHQLFREKI